MVNEEARFARERRRYLVAAAALVLGIALVASVDKKSLDGWLSGGLVLAGWAGAVIALHRLGRAGSKWRENP